MIKILRCIAFLFVVVLPVSFAHAGESGTVIKAEALKKEPFRDAKSAGTLAVGDKVDILKKSGGWLQVKSVKGKGWVRMLSIRRGAARRGSAGASGLASLATGRAGTGKVVATTGIRGLNEEELKAAKYNEAEVKHAESFSTTRADAKKFAASGKLKVQKVDYLAGERK